MRMLPLAVIFLLFVGLVVPLFSAHAQQVVVASFYPASGSIPVGIAGAFPQSDTEFGNCFAESNHDRVTAVKFEYMSIPSTASLTFQAVFYPGTTGDLTAGTCLPSGSGTASTNSITVTSASPRGNNTNPVVLTFLFDGPVMVPGVHAYSVKVLSCSCGNIVNTVWVGVASPGKGYYWNPPVYSSLGANLAGEIDAFDPSPPPPSTAASSFVLAFMVISMAAIVAVAYEEPSLAGEAIRYVGPITVGLALVFLILSAVGL